MENIKELSNKKKLLPIILAVVAIIVIIIIIALSSSKKSGEEGVTPEAPVTSGPVDGQPVGDAIDDIDGVEAGEAVNPVLADAVAVVEGANLISREGKVITNEGVEIKTDVSPMAAEAPRQTTALDKASLPASAIKLDISAAGFSPSEFTVKAGEAITITLSSTDEWSHSFLFNDPRLEAVSIGVSAGETRAISFNAPTQAGEYNFYCGVPGHANRGEVGKMIVE